MTFPYTDATGRRIKPTPITFEIRWLDYNGDHVGTDQISKVDLSAAVTYACNQLKANKPGYPRDAHGFYVRSMRKTEDNQR